ncbi:MAG: STAS domain-containing protein [Acidobacteriota bacterium]|nr:STAS domain-containing protein [Acidobacteriota bacterium]
MGLTVTSTNHGEVMVLALEGELDIYTVGAFRQESEKIDPGAAQVVVDLTDVTLLDSSGLGALVSLLNRARAADGLLGIVCPQRHLRRVFEITGLRRAFVFGDDLDGVRAALAEAETSAA